MNREIKFRAWDKENKKMVGEVVPYKDECLVYIGSTSEHGYVDKFEIMQFTGLKDKNGVEIFEGDIVSNHPLNKHLLTDMWWTIFYEGRWKGKPVIHHSIAGGMYLDDLSKTDRNFLEVIGNIHQVADLLTPEKGEG